MPKIVDHDQYRKELLGKCLTLFAERGYGSVTMRQIGQGLGVSTGTLYHYFPSKESILIQLVEELCEQDIASFFDQAPQEQSLDKRLQLVMGYFLEHLSFYQQQLLLWVEFYQQQQQKASENKLFLQKFWQRTHDQMAAYLELPPDKIDLMLVFMDGLLLQFLYHRGDNALDWATQQSQLLIELIQQD